jgi:hypothetical protein
VRRREVDVSWLREAMSDEAGQGDIAYGGLGAIIAMFIFVSVFLSAMVMTGYLRDEPFDPMPLAQAFSLITGAVFTTGLAGLTGYMLATRKQPTAQPDQTVIATNAVVHQEASQPAPAEAATDVVPSTTGTARKGKR